MATPPALAAKLTLTAVALAVLSSTPSLTSVSSPSPPDMAWASAVDVDVETAPETPATVKATLFELVTAFASTSIVPVF